MLSAIILAAGLSRRMKAENKLFLHFKGKSLVAQVIENIAESQADEVILVTSELSHAQLLEFASEKIKVVNNPNYKAGMTSSIQAGVKATSAESEGYMICLGDQPLIKTEEYNTIIKEFKQSYLVNANIIAVPFYQGQKGNPVIFSSFYKEQILAHQAPEGCKEIVQSNKSHIQKIALENPSILQDVDTKEDYEKLING